MSSFPYVATASIFNTLDYRIVEDSGISLAQADARYFQITGGYVSYVNSSAFYLNGAPLDFTLLAGITAGTVQANKLIAVDSNRDITNFRNISLSGTLIAANDISSPIINSNQYLLSGSSILTSALTGIVIGTASASKALVLDSNRDIVGINSISTTDLLVSGNAILSGTLSLPSLTSILTAQITDTNNASIAYPLTIQHLLSSGSPTDNAMEVGLNFQMPNSINNPVDYGAISCEVQQHASGLQQGQLNFYTSFAGSLVNAMTLSSLTSPTNNILVLNGATSLFSAYRLVCDNVLCNSNILINKATLPNLTITSTASSTLSLCYFNTDTQSWELGARGSSASNPNSFYLYNSGYMYTISNAGITKFFNSSVSTTSTSNAFQIAGGLYTAKAILNNSYYNCNSQFAGTSHGNAASQAICLYDQPIFFRNQNGADSNHGIMYSKNANWNSGNGWASANQDGPVLYGNQSVIIGNLNSSNTETSCAIFSGTETRLLGNCTIASTTDATSVSTGSLTTLGGISAAKTIYGKQLVADAFGSHLTLKNGANAYVLQSSQSDGILTFTCTYDNSNYAQYQFVSCSPGTSGSGANYKGQLRIGGTVRANDGHRLDFGNWTQNNIICLFQQDNVSGSYMLGANNSAINITSAGSNGVLLTYNSASGLGAPAQIGTTLFQAKGNGNCISTLNSIANGGVHSYGYNATDLSSYGPGAHMHYAASKASFFGYDYSGGSYKDLSLNNDNLYIKSSSGYIGIGTTSPSCPLHIAGTGNQSTASSFGFLSSGGTGIATGFTNRAFSIRCSGGIMCDSGEIDVLSDELWKENILDLNDDLVNKFIKKIIPIQFNYKNSTTLHYGYSAQNILLNNFNVIVGSASTDEPLDERELSNKEGDKIIIPKDTRLIVNPIDIIPLLHKALQLANERIKRNEEAIAELRELIKPAQEPAKLKRVVKKLNRVVYSSK